MSNGITAFVAFAIGAAVGAVVTWKLAKSKFEQMAQEEIDSVKESFSKAYGENKSEDLTVDEAKKMMTDLGYSVEKEDDKMRPYVISPDEFGEKDYKMETLTYYNDRVLADRWDEPIENPEELLGDEALGSFGEYEDDAVYVRNDALKIDYEILLDTRNHADVVEEM